MTRLIAAALFTMVGMSFGAAEAHAADWTIRIDNRANPDIIPHWNTTDDITIQIAYTKNGVNYITVGSGLAFENTISAELDFAVNNTNIPLAGVSYIIVHTNGTEMFVIDQLLILDTNGNTYYTSGIDNSVGYCLSEDVDDYDNNPECFNGTGGDRKYFYF